VSTPNRPRLGPGGEQTHAAMMGALTPDAPATLERHETTLADHDRRLTALEHPDGPHPGEGES
jgi:hypothetical protein